MEWQTLIALIIAVPVILFPVVLVWYMDIAGIYASIRNRRKLHIQKEQQKVTVASTEQDI
jgi:hypothetical protein